eukprot:13405965-Alexandrium_andersonii.AAC.1
MVPSGRWIDHTALGLDPGTAEPDRCTGGEASRDAAEFSLPESTLLGLFGQPGRATLCCQLQGETVSGKAAGSKPTTRRL